MKGVAKAFAGLMLAVALLTAPAGASGLPSDAAGAVSWGCSGTAAAPCFAGMKGFGLIAVAASAYDSIGLNVGGTLEPLSCGTSYGQCIPPGPLSGITSIAAGDGHTLALKNDGTVSAWGCGGPYAYGQCAVPSGLAGVAAIAAGTSQSLALKSDGTVVAWGCAGDDFGQCSVPSGLSGVTAIAAGDTHSLALRSDGTVVAWGCGAPYDFGQCSVPGGLSSVIAIAAGTSQSLAVKSDGTVVAWGCVGDDHDQCSVPAGLSNVVKVAAGDVHSVALKRDGTVVAWGCGSPYDHGQCTVPAGLSPVAGVSAGVDHTLVRFKRSQTMSLQSLPGTLLLTGPDITVSATTSSNLQAVFDTSGGCVVTGASMSLPGLTRATLHVTGAGLCTVTASQPGDVEFTAATPVSHTITIAKGDQTITFDPRADATFGDPDFTISASASSGLPVSFTATGSCTIRGTTVHIVGAGGCELVASQPGDANYNAAPDVSSPLIIAKAGQKITFAPLHKRVLGTRDFKVSASASSRLPVSFAAHGACRIRGATVHLTARGTCTIVASQRGDRNHDPAESVSRKFTIIATCTVPNVVGKPLASAKAALRRAQCGVGTVGSVRSNRPKNVVVSQTRRSGTRLPHATKIGLVVSRGR